MYKLKPQNKKELLKAALGEIPADLAVKNCKLVNVFTGEIYPAVVYVKGGFVAHVEREELEYVKEMVREKMQGAWVHRVPLLVEIGVGDNWLQAH